MISGKVAGYTLFWEGNEKSLGGVGGYKIVLEKKNEVIGHLNGHVRSNAEDYQDQHKGYGYRVRNKEGERILEFCVAIKMTVANTLFKVVSHWFT